MLMDIKFSNIQLSKIIQSGHFPGKLMSYLVNAMHNLSKKAVLGLAIALAKIVCLK